MTTPISFRSTPWIYNPHQKVKQDGTRAAIVGGGLCGATTLGLQSCFMGNPTGTLGKFYSNASKNNPLAAITNNKHNWKIVGITALVGAVLFGLCKALSTAYKNLPEGVSSSKTLNYKA